MSSSFVERAVPRQRIVDIRSISVGKGNGTVHRSSNAKLMLTTPRLLSFRARSERLASQGCQSCNCIGEFFLSSTQEKQHARLHLEAFHGEANTATRSTSDIASQGTWKTKTVVVKRTNTWFNRRMLDKQLTFTLLSYCLSQDVAFLQIPKTWKQDRVM